MIVGKTCNHHIAYDRIFVVKSLTLRASDDPKRMLSHYFSVRERAVGRLGLTPCICIGCCSQRSASTHVMKERKITGKSGIGPGIVTSTVLLRVTGMMLPLGSRSCGREAPLRICKSTGTDGGRNVTLFTANVWKSWKSSSITQLRRKGIKLEGPGDYTDGICSINVQQNVDVSTTIKRFAWLLMTSVWLTETNLGNRHTGGVCTNGCQWFTYK